MIVNTCVLKLMSNLMWTNVIVVLFGKSTCMYCHEAESVGWKQNECTCFETK